MSGLSRVAAYKIGKDQAAVIIVCDGQKIEIKQSDLTTLDAAEKVTKSLTTAASAAKATLPKIFLRKKADGSYAVATGEEPREWKVKDG